MNKDKTIVMKVIWGALLYSQLMYVGVLYMTKKDYIGVPFPSESPLLIPLLACAAAVAIAAIVVPNMLIQAAKKKIQEQPMTDAEPNYIAFYMVPWIVRMALFEAITLFGFVLAITTPAPIAIVPFAIVGLLGQAAQFPTEQKIKNAFRA